MSELDHFVVYKLPEKPTYISVLEKSIGISSGSFDLLGCPEYVNVFFDECGKRVMIKKATKTMPNVFKITSHQGGKNRVICSRPLTEKVREMFGDAKRIPGHSVSEECMIFDRVERGRHESKI